MKTIKLILILFVICTSSLSLGEEKNNERRTLVLAADYWCPYSCHPDSQMPGYLIELIRRALYIYRIDIEYRLLPWDEALYLVRKGEIDGVIGVSNVEGRNLLTTRLPQAYSSSYAYTRNDTAWIYDGVKSLRGRKLGIILDYVIEDSISHYIGRNYTFNPGAFSVQNGENAVIESIADLIDGASGVYIEDKRVVEHYINENGLDPYIRNAGKVGNKDLPVYIAFSKDLPNVERYIEYFTKGLVSLKATGELDDLREKYKMDMREIDEIQND